MPVVKISHWIWTHISVCAVFFMYPLNCQLYNFQLLSCNWWNYLYCLYYFLLSLLSFFIKLKTLLTWVFEHCSCKFSYFMTFVMLKRHSLTVNLEGWIVQIYNCWLQNYNFFASLPIIIWWNNLTLQCCLQEPYSKPSIPLCWNRTIIHAIISLL